jgi:tripartite-type tricarboxylate transporter receptor subunit TctC
VSIINRSSQEVVRSLKATDVKEKLLAMGVEVVGSSQSELTAAVKAEMARLGKVIRDTGIRDE